MSKNIVEYANYLFDVIVGDADVQNREKMRISKNKDIEVFKKELKDFEDLSIEEVRFISPGVKMAGISLRERHQILITKLDGLLTESITNKLAEFNISIIEPHIGVFLSIVKDANLNRNDSQEQGFFEEYIFEQQNDVHYSWHSFDDLKKCIEHFYLFEIEKDSLFYCRDHNEICHFICSFLRKFRVLPLESILPLFQEVLIDTGSYLRSDNIFNALSSAHWHYSFLELYRCIEALYSLPHALSLKKKLKIKHTGATIAKACFNELGWKRKEENSLKKILILLPNNVAQETKIDGAQLFKNSEFDFSNDEVSKKSYEKLGELIYKLRNSLVHYLELTDEFIPKNEEDWLVVIKFLLTAIKYIYNKYEDELVIDQIIAAN